MYDITALQVMAFEFERDIRYCYRYYCEYFEKLVVRKEDP